MASTHPYRQAYPTRALSQLPTDVPPEQDPAKMNSVYNSYQHRQQRHQQQQQQYPPQQQPPYPPQQQHPYQQYQHPYQQQQHPYQQEQHQQHQQQRGQQKYPEHPYQQHQYQHQELQQQFQRARINPSKQEDSSRQLPPSNKRVSNTHYLHLFEDRPNPNTGERSTPSTTDQASKNYKNRYTDMNIQDDYSYNNTDDNKNSSGRIITDEVDISNETKIPKILKMPSPQFLSDSNSSKSPSNASKSMENTPKAPDTPKGILSQKGNWSDSAASSPQIPAIKTNSESQLFGSASSLVSSNKPLTTSSSHDRSGSSLSVMINSPTMTPLNDSHEFIALQISNNPDSLMPKLKTVELYRQNAKKSHDPEVLFQYARYMLNTAIFMSVESNENIKEVNGHKKTKSTTSLLNVLNLDSDNTTESVTEDKSLMKKRFLKEALHYLRKLSDKGYSDAQYLLGDAYSSGAIGKVDEKEAFNLFQAAAKHGHIESAYRTSFCYEVGLGTARDSRKAIEFLKFAATKNHPSAMYKMGLYSFYGRMGLSNNTNTKKDGIKWLKRASENANELIAAAPYELGKIHYEGFKDIIIQDKVYALELFRQAASLGHIQSAAILAKHYEMGDIIPQDPELSIHYYTQAALGGDAESMLGLCGWFMVGATNLEKNEHESFEWALKAANKGLPKAQFATGHFLEKGIGCEKNQDAAIVWFQKAAENHDERAIKKLKGTKFEKQDEKKGWKKKLFA